MVRETAVPVRAQIPSDVDTPLERDELETIARQAGCRVLQTVVRDISGRQTVVLELDAHDNSKAVLFLNAIARHDAHHPEVRTRAIDLRESLPRPISTGAFARAVQAYVKERVEFMREADECFQHTLYTLDHGAGDCDDHARAVVALLIAGGERARVVGVPKANGVVAHVCGQVWDKATPGGWTWVETTVDARYGEHPFEAAVRLGIMKTRPDIARAG